MPQCPRMKKVKKEIKDNAEVKEESVSVTMVPMMLTREMRIDLNVVNVVIIEVVAMETVEVVMETVVLAKETAVETVMDHNVGSVEVVEVAEVVEEKTIGAVVAKATEQAKETDILFRNSNWVCQSSLLMLFSKI